ncbi:Hypothetical protein SMAX5B_006189 [Scophthalmus maximus]|uniref:Uncharacterized protein n=1 Tax=Scophthalmus maximus TaxID=52904 RepID=A0A2U9BJD3_SCOMX|nr:Hypothetical protein SMAX5B_006189 [Scophthalmus maximus]
MGPTVKEPSFPHLDSGLTPEQEEAIPAGSQVVPFSGSLSGEESGLPTVTASGGHKGQRGPPSRQQHCDTQQMMQVAEGTELPDVSRGRSAVKVKNLLSSMDGL